MGKGSSKQSIVLKAKGLYRQPNNLGSIPDGALEEAKNVYIRREDTVEPRRGFNFYGPEFGSINDRAKQLLVYKKTLIRHYSDILEYDNGSGVFTAYSGSFESPDSRLKIRGSELNGNFYITTNSGIKRLDKVDSQFQNAGVVEALDLEAALVNSEGFFTADNQVGYRLVWGFKDANNNLLLGAPSAFTTIANVGSDLLVPDFNQFLQNIDSSGYYDIDYFATLSLSLGATNVQILGSESPLAGLKGLAKKLEDDPNTTLTYTTLVGSDTTFSALADYFDEIVAQLNNEPATIVAFTNEARRSQQVQLTFTIPDEVTEDYFYQLYRSPLSGGAEISPLDDVQLVFEGNPTTLEIANKIVSLVDVTPDSFRGVALYSNANQEGAGQTNNRPPFAKDIASFKNALFYANTRSVERLNISLLTTSGLSNTSTLVFNNGTDSFTISFNDTTENPSIGQVKFYTTGTPAQNVDLTARSFIKVLNRYLVNTFLYARYASGEGDVPGKLLVYTRNLQSPAFYVVADSASTGNSFDPSIPTSGNTYVSTNETSPNRLYYSKEQRPDAVPLLNYFDIGRKDREILRIIGLRDSLFVFKEDGIFRVIGDTINNLTQVLFDNSVIITAPESPAIGNNQIYLLTDQGVIKLSDTGRDVISRPIEDLILPLNSPKYTNFISKTFGLFYTTERQYYLWTVSEYDDEYPTTCYVLNTFTEAWTTLPITKTCGIVHPKDDKMYLGAGDINWIEQERKNFDRTDYSDRQYDTQIVEFEGTRLTLNTLENMSVGDVISQKEYLTPYQFNATLYSLDSDAALTFKDYTSLLISKKSELYDALYELADKLDNDPSLPETIQLITNIQVGNPAIVTSVGHGLETGQSITISSTNSTPNINGIYQVTVLSDDTFSVPVNVTVAGTIGAWTNSYTSALLTSTTPQSVQTSFNNLITRLLNDPRSISTDFYLSEQTLDFYTHILEIDDSNGLQIVVEDIFDWDMADITYYNHIPTLVTWSPLHAGDPSMFKQFREAELMFSRTNGKFVNLSFSSDIIQSFAEVQFTDDQSQGWGNGAWGTTPWGDYPGPRDFRTYVPAQQQKCRFLQPKFGHVRAFEDYLLVGLSLTVRLIDVRVNR